MFYFHCSEIDSRSFHWTSLPHCVTFWLFSRSPLLSIIENHKTVQKKTIIKKTKTFYCLLKPRTKKNCEVTKHPLIPVSFAFVWACRFSRMRNLVAAVGNCFFSTGWWPLFCFIAYRSTTKAWECSDAISDLTCSWVRDKFSKHSHVAFFFIFSELCVYSRGR